MSPDQFRRYRQVGTYGAYRVIFRTVPGLTIGDGWTLADTGLKLAKLVNNSLPRDIRLKDDRFETGTKWGHWIGDEARYWVTRGWPDATGKANRGMLPTADSKIWEELPEDERLLLEPVLFGDDSIRRVAAEALASAKGVYSHTDLCVALANSKALAEKIEPKSIAPLPAFTRFADASMHAIRGLWGEINTDAVEQSPAVDTLARSSDLPERFDKVRETGGAWLRTSGRSEFPHGAAITSLAEAMKDAKTPIEQLRAIAHHHHEYGGGRRWFREESGNLVPLMADTGIPASDYRFRLRPLSLLAAQCGVADMSKVLHAVEKNEFEGASPPDPDDMEGDML